MRSYLRCFQAFKDLNPPNQEFVVQLYYNAETASQDKAQVFEGIPSDVWVVMPKKRDFMTMMNQIARADNLVEWFLGDHSQLLVIETSRPSRN